MQYNYTSIMLIRQLAHYSSCVSSIIKHKWELARKYI